METLIREINSILKKKNEEIELLKWENELLARKNKELEQDIEKYRENEVNRV